MKDWLSKAYNTLTLNISELNSELIEAVQNNQLSKARALIEKGAEVNCKDNNGDQVLLLALIKDYIEAAKLLIEKGADINSKNNHGITPVHVAVGHGLLEITKLLLEKGASIYDITNNGHTILHFAAGYPDPLQTQLIINKLNSNYSQSNFITRAFTKSMQGIQVYSTLEMLNKATDKGDTPLHEAAKSGDFVNAWMFVQEHASINVFNKAGETPVNLAFNNGHIYTTAYFLRKGYDKSMFFKAVLKLYTIEEAPQFRVLATKLFQEKTVGLVKFMKELCYEINLDTKHLHASLYSVLKLYQKHINPAEFILPNVSDETLDFPLYLSQLKELCDASPQLSKLIIDEYTYSTAINSYIKSNFFAICGVVKSGVPIFHSTDNDGNILVSIPQDIVKEIASYLVLDDIDIAGTTLEAGWCTII